jgi:hypothetical protein
MSDDPKRTVKKVAHGITQSVDQYVDALLKNLKRLTPTRSGQAQRGWRKDGSYDAGSNTTTVVIQNPVSYSGVLDAGSSRQAPSGIVKPAISRTRKP